MSDSKWERYGALGGVVFVMLDLAVAFLGGEPPATDAARSDVVRHFADHTAAIEAGLWLFGLGTVALMWWSGSLWRRMVRSEGEVARLAVVSMVGLAVAGALSLASTSVSTATALRIDDVGDSLVVLHAISVILLAASGFGVATHVLAASVLGARTHSLPSWVVGVGLVSAAGFVGSVVFDATAHAEWAATASIVGFSFWCVWILGVSSCMWRDLRAPAAVGTRVAAA